MLVNDELVETCRLYDVAPLEAFHVNVGVVETPVVPLAGEESIGADNVVVNDHTPEYPPI